MHCVRTHFQELPIRLPKTKDYEPIKNDFKNWNLHKLNPISRNIKIYTLQTVTVLQIKPYF